MSHHAGPSLSSKWPLAARQGGEGRVGGGEGQAGSRRQAWEKGRQEEPLAKGHPDLGRGAGNKEGEELGQSREGPVSVSWVGLGACGVLWGSGKAGDGMAQVRTRV